MEDIVDMKLNDVVEKIRGKRKTIVRLEVHSGRRHARTRFTPITARSDRAER